MSPNQREVLSAISTITGKQEYLTSTGGVLNSGATLSGSAIPASGLSSAAAVQIVDGSGNQITSFGGGTQYIDGGSVPTHPTAPTLVYDNAGTWQHVSVANPLPVNASVTITGVATSANQTNASQKTQIVDGSGNVIAATSNALDVQVANSSIAVTGTFFQTTQPVSGTITANQGTAAALTSGWPTINGELSDVTGTFTNATQTTSVTATGLDGYGNTLISINGTYGAATAVFEGSDDGGTTWYTVQAARDNSNVIELGYTSLTNTNQTWQINNPGFDSLRVRSTAVASGTVSVRLSSSAAPVASGTIIGLGTSIPAGSNAIGSITNTSFIATQATGTNLHTVLDSGTLTAVTAITNALPAGANAIGTVGTTSAVVNVAQKTVNTTAVQLSASSTVPTNGIIVQALSTNAASIFVGGSGVTTSTGFELVAGQAMSFTSNLNTLYIISVASTTDKVCYNVQ